MVLIAVLGTSSSKVSDLESFTYMPALISIFRLAAEKSLKDRVRVNAKKEEAETSVSVTTRSFKLMSYNAFIF